MTQVLKTVIEDNESFYEIYSHTGDRTRPVGFYTFHEKGHNTFHRNFYKNDLPVGLLMTNNGEWL